MRRHISRPSASRGSLSSVAGFTLIEVVIALVISAFIVLTGRQMLEAIGGESRRVHRAAEESTLEANADRVLRELVGRMEIGSTIERGFGGTGHQATFSSWCEVPEGWLESCRVSLTIDSAAHTNALVLTTRLASRDEAQGAQLVMRQGFAYGALRYLSSASDGGVWFHAWGQGITAPLAIGIILGSDTAIVAIGERG